MKKTRSFDGETLDLTVDYTRTVAEMIEAGKYDWSNKQITSDHYPIPEDKIGKSERISAKVFHFYHSKLSKDIVEEMEKEGYRPATAHEIMAFGEKSQKQFPMAAFGSVWEDGHDQCVLVLRRRNSRRTLGLAEHRGGWSYDNYFLGVRK